MTGKIAREAQVPYQFFATTPFDSFITHSFSGSSITCIRFSTAYFFSLHVLIDEMIAVANMKRAMQVVDERSSVGIPSLDGGQLALFVV